MKRVIWIATALILLGTSPQSEMSLPSFCAEIASQAHALRWNTELCNGGVHWQVLGRSVQGRPLIAAQFGKPFARNTTLILAAVHGDEITPVYLGIKVAHWLREQLGTYSDQQVVIAPIVNPDGFLAKPRTRVNARGVDLNRNFATRDWKPGRRGGDRRRFPGLKAQSEPETQFQLELIRRFKPTKILSIHSPLNVLDYDGPSQLSLKRFPKDYVKSCLDLRQELKASSSGFFPGSLGNMAGRELGIPVVTLELPTADPIHAERYWREFRNGIRTMVEFDVGSGAAHAAQKL